jgi:hypothetical protein
MSDAANPNLAVLPDGTFGGSLQWLIDVLPHARDRQNDMFQNQYPSGGMPTEEREERNRLHEGYRCYFLSLAKLARMHFAQIRITAATRLGDLMQVRFEDEFRPLEDGTFRVLDPDGLNDCEQLVPEIASQLWYFRYRWISYINTDFLKIDPKPKVPQPGDEPKYLLAPKGAVYEIRGFGEMGCLPDLTGIKNLIQLIQKPGKTITWHELLGFVSYDSQSKQPIFEDEEMAKYYEKRRRLVEEIESSVGIDRTDSEETLKRHDAEWGPNLKKNKTGQRRESRDLNDPVPKKRSTIDQRLRKVYEKLRMGKTPMPILADHFKKCISSNCDGYTYDPPHPIPMWVTTLPEK